MVLPIPRVKPLGWVMDELLLPSLITQMDLNISLLDAAIDQQRLIVPASNWPERAVFTNSSSLNSEVPIAWDSGSNGISSFMVVTGNTTSIISSDGQNWRNPVSYGGILGAAAHDLAAGLSGAGGGQRSFLASQQGGTNLMRTVNGGTTWTLTGGNVATNAVLCNGPGTFWVACANTGFTKHSTDGLTFTTVGQTLPIDWVSDAKRVVWSGTAFVVLPAQAGAFKVLRSPDGINWSEYLLPVAATWTGLAYSSTLGYWMAVSAGGDIATSPDGVTWTTSPSVGFAAGASDLACLGSVFCASSPNGIQFSIGGGLWTVVAVGDQSVASGWNRVIAADQRFIAVHATGTQLEFALSLRFGP